MAIPAQNLLAEIEAYLRRAGMSETSFGLATVNDGHLIRDLRRGKDIRLSTEARIRDFMSGPPAARTSSDDQALPPRAAPG